MAQNRRKNSRGPARPAPAPRPAPAGRIDQGDDVGNALAMRVQVFEPIALRRLDANQRRVALRLVELVQQQREFERRIDQAVGKLRDAGASWAVVALATGFTPEGARKKWGPK